ncbi:MAG: VOC family protein, partial [Acidimicrobiales bacterium]
MTVAETPGPFAGDIDGINHVGVVVRSMDAATAAYERMGFVLTPLSMHAGSPQPGGAIVEYGTGNRTVMFARSYIEVLAVFDRSKY